MTIDYARRRAARARRYRHAHMPRARGSASRRVIAFAESANTLRCARAAYAHATRAVCAGICASRHPPNPTSTTPPPRPTCPSGAARARRYGARAMACTMLYDERYATGIRDALPCRRHATPRHAFCLVLPLWWEVVWGCVCAMSFPSPRHTTKIMAAPEE